MFSSIMACAVLLMLIRTTRGQRNLTSPYVDTRQHCQHHHLRVTEKSWIIGENAINGLCNQILGIFSYVPVAILWDVNLVVGEMFSRSSFEAAASNLENWKRVPFSTFFDWAHFSRFWLQHGLRTMEFHEYLQHNNCSFNNQSTVVTIVKDPSFWPVKNSILMEMLAKSSVPFPIPPNKVLKLDDEHSKFTALFNYWKGGLKHKLLLLKVHNSLRPSPAVSRVLHALVDELPADFVCVHVRLEADYLLFKKLSFDKELPAALAHIRSHKCFRSDPWASNSSRSLPIFVASGLFSGGVGSTSNIYSSAARAQSLLRGLGELGFSEVYTRQSLIDRVMRDAGKRSIQGIVDDFDLLPEVGAMVDLLISRHERCSCFVDSHQSSSFSYMAQRLRQMDGGQVLKYTEITPELFGVSEEFKQWGV